MKTVGLELAKQLKCTKCGEIKPISMFYHRKSPHKYPSDEYHSWCKSCYAQKSKREYVNAREKKLGRAKELRILNNDVFKKRQKSYYLKIRTEVINRYGGKCVCCGESQLAFLALDHIAGGGNEHRRSIKTTTLTYWARKNNYPPIFQVLCHNCNMAKHYQGVCPHKI